MIRLSDLDPEMKTFVMNVAQCAANKALEEADLLKPYISLKAAERKYGYAIVHRWIAEGLITFQQDGEGSKYRILRAQIEAVAAASNRTTYLKTKDR